MATRTRLQTNTTESMPARVAAAILDFVSKIPRTDETKTQHPTQRARSIANVAAAKAALVAGALAIPPGPLGLLTVLPDLIAIWKIQARMVADIAGIFGKTATLTQEQMLYCLFRHTAAQAVRDVVVRVGERVMVKRATLRTLQSVASRIGVRLTQRVIGRGVSRWLPIVGAVGVGGYVYFDTANVAKTAIALFESEIKIESVDDQNDA